MTKLLGSWERTISEVKGMEYNCGFCGIVVGPSLRYICTGIKRVNGGHTTNTRFATIAICPNCNKPTYLSEDLKEHIPGPLIGNSLKYLPQEIENLYNEARNCISVNAYTSSVLSCRKLLMNVSVSKGAPLGKKFIEYVNFLDENHYTPPDSKEWVDHIRKTGNEATHDIPSIEKDDAIELLEFTEMLLRFMYEMPGKMMRHRK